MVAKIENLVENERQSTTEESAPKLDALESAKQTIQSTKLEAHSLTEFNKRVYKEVDQLIRDQQDVYTDPETSEQAMKEALTKMCSFMNCLRGVRQAIKEHRQAVE